MSIDLQKQAAPDGRSIEMHGSVHHTYFTVDGRDFRVGIPIDPRDDDWSPTLFERVSANTWVECRPLEYRDLVNRLSAMIPAQ